MGKADTGSPIASGTDARAKVPGIGGDDLHGVGCGAGQEIVECCLVPQRNGADLGRNRKDDLEVLM